jgi:glycosyltransferase involved in cell wall biosynthesis
MVLGSFEVPGLGGSSTASFNLFARMQAEHRDVHYVNLIHGNEGKFREIFGPSVGNPQGLSNVTNCWLTGSVDDVHPQIGTLVESINPSIVVGFGYIAALLVKRAAPTRPTVLITGTCRQAQDYVSSGRTKDAITLRQTLAHTARPLRLVNGGERTSMERCDFLIAHSTLVLEFVDSFFAPLRGKIYPQVISSSEWICDGARAWQQYAREFDRRDIDALFIATDWDRPEKNYRLVESIARRLRGRAIHVVGDVPRSLRSVSHHGLVADRSELFELVGRARSVICPSLMDAAPGILFEGSVLGCNVIASRNCGNWELCHPELLVDPYDADGFVECIERGAKRKYKDNLESFLALRSYDDLMKTLDAFARPFESKTQQ